MRADITTIPLQDAFAPRDGCPLCRLTDMLQQRMITYITGAAMMESDVRKETNRAGFCHTHLGQMLQAKNRLSVALTLQSHLDEVEKQLFPRIGSGQKAAQKLMDSCFVCEQIEWALTRMIPNICRQYETDREFRELFSQQEMLCVPHYIRLSEASSGMGKRWRGEFNDAAKALCHQYLRALQADVNHFTRMFDYRSRLDEEGNSIEPDWGTSRDVLERAMWWLSGN